MTSTVQRNTCDRGEIDFRMTEGLSIELLTLTPLVGDDFDGRETGRRIFQILTTNTDRSVQL